MGAANTARSASLDVKDASVHSMHADLQASAQSSQTRLRGPSVAVAWGRRNLETGADRPAFGMLPLQLEHIVAETTHAMQDTSKCNICCASFMQVGRRSRCVIAGMSPSLAHSGAVCFQLRQQECNFDPAELCPGCAQARTALLVFLSEHMCSESSIRSRAGFSNSLRKQPPKEHNVETARQHKMKRRLARQLKESIYTWGPVRLAAPCGQFLNSIFYSTPSWRLLGWTDLHPSICTIPSVGFLCSFRVVILYKITYYCYCRDYHVCQLAAATSQNATHQAEEQDSSTPVRHTYRPLHSEFV